MVYDKCLEELCLATIQYILTSVQITRSFAMLEDILSTWMLYTLSCLTWRLFSTFLQYSAIFLHRSTAN